MTRATSREQPYQIAYSAAVLVGGAFYFYLLVFFSAMGAYLAFLVPLSYQRPDSVRQIWQVGVWTLWLVAFLSGVIVIGLRAGYGREIRWLGWTALLSNWIVWSVLYALSFLGLYPLSAFLPSVILATALAYFLVDQLYTLVFRHKHYLSRSMTFVEHGSLWLALISATSLLFVFGQVVHSLLSPERRFTSGLVISVLELIGLALITYFAANIDLNDPSSSRFKTIVCVPVCLALAVATCIDRGFLSFWWLGMGGLSSSIFYTAHSPTRRKSTGFSIGLYSAMTVALFLDVTTFAPSVSQFWAAIKDVVLPVLGIVVTLVVGGQSLLKTIFPKSRSHTISKADVLEASEDFVVVDGLSVGSVDHITQVAIMSREFDFCDQLYSHPSFFLGSDELREYFEICYLCLRFISGRRIEVLVDDSEQTNQHKVIKTREEFADYINRRFPTRVHSDEIWRAYAGKNYIREYVIDKAINGARPDTLRTRSAIYVRNALVVLLVFLVFSSQILIPFLSSQPRLIWQLSSWNSVRKNEVQLLLVAAVQPFQLDDAAIREYYALSMWDWIQSRELYAGEHRNGALYMTSDTMKTQIGYLQMILSFYEGRDDLSLLLSNELGGYYKGLGDCDRAFDYFEGVIETAESVEYRDFAIATSADCYRNQDVPKALSLLEEVRNDTAYVRSRSVLAEIYYQQQRYAEIVGLLSPNPDSLDATVLSLLGASLYHEGKYTQAIEVLEEASANDRLAADRSREIYTHLYLGASFFETDDFFQSAEHYFWAFSGQTCPPSTVLSSEHVELHIPRFKSAVDSVIKQNPYDHRTNLWNFVYFLYVGEAKQASEFFNAHLAESATYEREFTQCIIDISENN